MPRPYHFPQMVLHATAMGNSSSLKCSLSTGPTNDSKCRFLQIFNFKCIQNWGMSATSWTHSSKLDRYVPMYYTTPFLTAIQLVVLIQMYSKRARIGLAIRLPVQQRTLIFAWKISPSIVRSNVLRVFTSNVLRVFTSNVLHVVHW